MFYIQVVERDDSFASAYIAIKNYFNYNTTTSFAYTRIENPKKGLHKNFKGEDALRTTIINACYRVSKLKIALFKLATIYKELFLDLQSVVKTHLAQ
ncbi:hypothetical protein BDW02DRAFT_593166 [Decorospora gaudefroyi]|uniref:Uncharacterized protein n=1 Tax=Decorospora gaudefroyi TaxID=184978 RepID=A0A6A5JVT2_9PLEO|nr:hypothetical protein BDW02DRAFT_593166 [Decorospora gaudefroyi]